VHVLRSTVSVPGRRHALEAFSRELSRPDAHVIVSLEKRSKRKPSRLAKAPMVCFLSGVADHAIALRFALVKPACTLIRAAIVQAKKREAKLTSLSNL